MVFDIKYKKYRGLRWGIGFGYKFFINVDVEEGERLVGKYARLG